MPDSILSEDSGWCAPAWRGSGKEVIAKHRDAVAENRIWVDAKLDPGAVCRVRHAIVHGLQLGGQLRPLGQK